MSRLIGELAIALIFGGGLYYFATRVTLKEDPPDKDKTK